MILGSDPSDPARFRCTVLVRVPVASRCTSGVPVATLLQYRWYRHRLVTVGGVIGPGTCPASELMVGSSGFEIHYKRYSTVGQSSRCWMLDVDRRSHLTAHRLLLRIVILGTGQGLRSWRTEQWSKLVLTNRRYRTNVHRNRRAGRSNQGHGSCVLPCLARIGTAKDHLMMPPADAPSPLDEALGRDQTRTTTGPCTLHELAQHKLSHNSNILGNPESILKQDETKLHKSSEDRPEYRDLIAALPQNSCTARA